MLDLDVFDQGIERLKENFPDATFTEYKYQIWFDKLETQLSNEEFQTAVREAIYKNRFCPTGEELVSLVKASERELVLDCWSKCLDALSRRTSLNDLDDASQYAIALLGGLTYLGELSIYEINKLKPDFCTHWNSYRKNPKEFRRGAAEWAEYQKPNTGDSVEVAKRSELPSDTEANVARYLNEAKAKASRRKGRGLLQGMKEATQLLEGNKNQPPTNIEDALEKLCSFPSEKSPEPYQQVAQESIKQHKEELGDLTVSELGRLSSDELAGYQLNLESEFAQAQKSYAQATQKRLAETESQEFLEDPEEDMPF